MPIMNTKRKRKNLGISFSSRTCVWGWGSKWVCVCALLHLLSVRNQGKAGEERREKGQRAQLQHSASHMLLDISPSDYVLAFE